MEDVSLATKGISLAKGNSGGEIAILWMSGVAVTGTMAGMMDASDGGGSWEAYGIFIPRLFIPILIPLHHLQ